MTYLTHSIDLPTYVAVIALLRNRLFWRPGAGGGYLLRRRVRRSRPGPVDHTHDSEQLFQFGVLDTRIRIRTYVYALSRPEW